MEEILRESEKMIEKISFLESYVSLHLRRDKIEPHIQELATKTEAVKSLILQCNEVMKGEYINAMSEYKLLMQKMQEQQLQVLKILIEKKQTANEEESRRQQYLVVGPSAGTGSRTPSGVLKERQPKSTKKSHLAVQSVQKPVTGEMYLGEYLQSPFVRKTKSALVPFQFLDFKVKITPQMFGSIPKYMRGRESLEELTSFLDTILVPCFNEKYQLLHRHRDCIRNPVEMDMWKVYKEQVSYFPGQNFITQGDISRKIEKMLDKKSQNKIVMLRHLGILQEQRKAQTVCYIWTANNV